MKRLQAETASGHIPPLQGCGELAGTWTRAFSPGCHIAGLQPFEHCTDSQSVSLRISHGSGGCRAGITPANLVLGLKASDVIAWAEASPTSAGPGYRSPENY